MKTYKFRVNKNDLELINHYYKGYKGTRDTITVECYDEKGNCIFNTTYYIYKGKSPLYGMCCKINGKYVFAKYSRYEAIDENLIDYAIDTDEYGNNHSVFTTMHYKIVNGETRV